MAAPPEPGLGEVFAGRYVIQRLLGEGDRKRTYLARDTKLDRQVALSFVKPDAVLSDPEGTEREAKVLGRIGSHPNIVSLYDYDISHDGSAQYIVFEYLGGGTLTAHLRETGPMPLDALLRLGRQLCRGLAHLHGRGLIHRDVSPDNVWLDERRVAHLGDFDSAITAGSDANLPITTGSCASPEELQGGPVDHRSDLYSLGLLLHVAAAGERFPGHLELLSHRTDLPSSFQDLLADLLADSPADRPADADAARRLLDVVLRASNISALIATGESNELEFKASLYHAYDPLPGNIGGMPVAQAQKEVRKGLHKAVTKTLAAFLNSQGGILLIGVSDSGVMLGIQADFPYLEKGKQNADGWLLALRHIVSNALGPEAWDLIDFSLVWQGDALVAVLQCPRRRSETWHSEGKEQRFYVRTSSASDELTGPSLVRHIREHWTT
jgi:serine/threonine-protein kinase